MTHLFRVGEDADLAGHVLGGVAGDALDEPVHHRVDSALDSSTLGWLRHGVSVGLVNIGLATACAHEALRCLALSCWWQRLSVVLLV